MARYGSPEILNTDQGLQFTSAPFLEVVRGRPIRISMDGRGCCHDNVFVERFWTKVRSHALEAETSSVAGPP